MDYLNSLRNFLSGAGNAVQKNIIKPVQAEAQQVGTFGQNLLNNANYGFWHSPVGTGLVNLQKATPAYQQGGQEAFGVNGFLKNNQGIQNYVPQFQAPKINNPVEQFAANVGAGIANLPANIGTGMVAPIVNLGTDVGRVIAGSATGKGALPYNNLKSPISRLEYNAAGVNRTPQQVIGNIGGTGADLLNYAIPGGAEAITKQGIEQAAKQGLFQAVKKGATEGGKFMALQGGLQGLSEGRNENLPEQLLSGAKGAAQGLVTGVTTGGLLSGGTHALGVIADAFPKASKIEQSQIQQLYNRDVQTGKFAPAQPKNIKANLQNWVRQVVGKNPGEPVFHSDLQKALGNQAGFIKPDEFGIKEQLQQPPEPPRMSSEAIRNGLEKPLKGSDISVSTQAEKRFNLKTQGEPIPWEAPGYQPLKQGVEVPTDVATQERATAQSALEGQAKSQSTQSFQDWVNARKASKVEGLLKQREFSDLNDKGINGIFEFQSGNKEGRFGDVKKYFDDKYNQVKDAGVDLNYKKDYLPQLWDNSPEEVEKVFGRSLGTKPSFSLDSVIKNYQEGIDAGLKPKFGTIGDLAGWYEQRANKAIADVSFFKGLAKDGFIQPANKAPQDWITLNSDSFPKVTSNIDGNTYNGVYKAPPEIADKINNYLYTPSEGSTFSRGLDKTANFVSRAKNITLSAGVPNPVGGVISKLKGESFAEGAGTGINAHGFNILARHTLGGTGGNPITRLLTGTKYMLNPASAEEALTKTLSTAPEAVKNGLTLSGEEHTALLNETENFAKSLGKNWNTIFEKPLFNKMIPALKLSSYNELVKGGMEGKEAAKLVNNVYGGINWEQLGRSRDTQNLLRSLVLAPDWAEGTVKLGANLIKSPFAKGEAAGRYKTMAATILGSYVALNVANLLTSGHLAIQNDPGHTFELEAGYTSDGQKRYVRPYGTAVDFLRLPVDAAVGLAKGDPGPAFRAITNRLSIPLSAMAHLGFNTNYKGQAIYGKDKYGNEIPPLQAAGGIGSEVVGSLGFPSILSNVIDYGTGKQGGEQALTQGLELPFRYSGGAYSKSQKFVQSLAQDKGANGKDLYDLNQKMNGVTLTDMQKNVIKSGGLKILPDILEQKQVNSTLNQIKKVQQQAADGEVTEKDATTKVNDLINQLPDQNIPKKQADAGGADKAYAAGNTPSNLQTKVQEQIARQRVELTGKQQDANGKLFYSENGNVQSVDLNPIAQQPELTGSSEIDKPLIAKYKADITSAINDNVKLYQLKRISQDEAIKRIDALKNQSLALGGTKTRKLNVQGLTLKLPTISVRKTKTLSPANLKVKTRTIKKLTYKNTPLSLKQQAKSTVSL